MNYGRVNVNRNREEKMQQKRKTIIDNSFPINYCRAQNHRKKRDLFSTINPQVLTYRDRDPCYGMCYTLYSICEGAADLVRRLNTPRPPYRSDLRTKMHNSIACKDSTKLILRRKDGLVSKKIVPIYPPIPFDLPVAFRNPVFFF